MTVSNYFIVPGLMDNAKQGVQRGKFIINGDEIAQIFKPVLKEIIKLVRGQIAATSRDVKAILLVGGFGGECLPQRVFANGVGL